MDFVETIQLLDVCKHGRKLHNMMKMNPWLLDKIEAFIHKEEVQLRRTEIEMIKTSTEILEGTDATSFRFRLESKVRLIQQIQIALLYSSLMKLIYEKQPTQNDDFLLHKQHTLGQMIRRYQGRWKVTEPLVSVQLITNTKTGELEVNIIRKQLHTTENRLLIRERNRLALQKYKSILKDCGRAKLRKERHLARLEARGRIRDNQRQGLIQIDQDFMARMQRVAKQESVDQLELSLSTLDLDDCENDEIDIMN
ncbi:hypothetical protein C0J52_23247 [Blattella germanica]|nr:hypothetical protein C0J52_23247 [Blattella germanica]